MAQIKRASPNLTVDIEQGSKKANAAVDVIVASVPTLSYNNGEYLRRFDPKKFKCVMIDEAHHAIADTYMRIINHFVSPEHGGNPDLLLWGCSATLRRPDGIGLYAVFDKIVFHKEFLDMVKEGWLCGIKAVTVETTRAIKGIAKFNGDFSNKMLSKMINVKERNMVVVQAYKKLAIGRKSTLVFAVSIQHTLDLCKEFRSQGVDAAYLIGATPGWERDRILSDFTNGRLPVLVNCNILTEGTDIPNIDCVMMARPTRSSILFIQMIGRGMRRHEGKADSLIIDFVDHFKKGAKLITLPTLLGTDPALVQKYKPRPFRIIQPNQIEQMKECQKEAGSMKNTTNGSTVSVEFNTHVHPDPLKFFDLEKTPNNTAHQSESDDVLFNGLRLCDMSMLPWEKLSNRRYVVHVGLEYYFVTQYQGGLWKGSIQPTLWSDEFAFDLEADTLQHAINGVDTLIEPFNMSLPADSPVWDFYQNEQTLSEWQKEWLNKYEFVHRDNNSICRNIHENGPPKTNAMNVIRSMVLEAKNWLKRIG